MRSLMHCWRTAALAVLFGVASSLTSYGQEAVDPAKAAAADAAQKVAEDALGKRAAADKVVADAQGKVKQATQALAKA
ncbi:MAG: hypothetical protein NT069_00205, partial [Planctomycetota bacterium]|nr:hypothetical protein [Planctomycetota bacterium]